MTNCADNTPHAYSVPRYQSLTYLSYYLAHVNTMVLSTSAMILVNVSDRSSDGVTSHDITRQYYYP